MAKNTVLERINKRLDYITYAIVHVLQLATTADATMRVLLRPAHCQRLTLLYGARRARPLATATTADADAGLKLAEWWAAGAEGAEVTIASRPMKNEDGLEIAQR